MERITSAQPPPSMAKHASMDISDMQGMDFPMYVYKPRRGMKRSEDSKDTYKLPHRLIEKKRRDRINECIAQLKDLLPEHLKLTVTNDLAYRTVVKENVGMVSNSYGFIAGEQGNGHSENSEEMFRSGFHLCAKEVLQFLANQETMRDLTPAHIINHLQKVASEFIQSPPSPCLDEPTPKAPEIREKPASPQPKAAEGHAKNCVPVIQRTYPHSSEQSGSDTDTDSGYGGELEKRELKAQRSVYYSKDAGDLKHNGNIKEELDEPQAKRQRSDSSEDESLSGPDIVGGHSPYMSFSPHQPLCMPFYLFPHGAAAAYLPMLEKCWYPGAMPVLYQGLGGSPAGMSPEKLPSSLVMSSRVGSPVTTPTSMDSPALLQALKQVPPLNLETKD
uniref:Class E basic helix-loop-helix protein 40-like n=1 Tax=Sinocyclocheilus grahami TaxID=75366 RepID=A0A672KVU2_SINGR